MKSRRDFQDESKNFNFTTRYFESATEINKIPLVKQKVGETTSFDEATLIVYLSIFVCHKIVCMEIRKK